MCEKGALRGRGRRRCLQNALLNHAVQGKELCKVERAVAARVEAAHNHARVVQRHGPLAAHQQVALHFHHGDAATPVRIRGVKVNLCLAVLLGAAGRGVLEWGGGLS